jgi:transcriptional regulator with XRE-family HTH domain
MFRIKDIIKDKGLTISELASQLNIDRITLSRQINCNPTMPTLTTLQKIANALEVEVCDLFERSDTKLTAFVEYKENIYKAGTLNRLKEIVAQIEKTIPGKE